jgi:Zn-dependent peptidase ImmA (M78 family)
MKQLHLDKNGIPILSRIDLEEKAERFLNFFEPTCLKEPRLTPLAAISLRLHKEFKVKFAFGVELGSTPEGYKYRGRFHIPTTTILIDKSLPEGEPRFNFTLAHEIAHFVLHRKVNLSVLEGEKDRQISDTNRDLILDQIEGDDPRKWLEWQANKFASSLLLPRFTVPNAVISIQKDIGITRNIGIVYLDRQRANYSDYRELLNHLMLIYQASKSAIRLRLRELGLLREVFTESDENEKGPAHFREFLGSIVDSWDEL